MQVGRLEVQVAKRAAGPRYARAVACGRWLAMHTRRHLGDPNVRLRNLTPLPPHPGRLTMVTGMPPLSQYRKLMCSPARSASVAVTMLAEAPMRVPLPPKQAPKLRDQARICVARAGSECGSGWLAGKGREGGGGGGECKCCPGGRACKHASAYLEIKTQASAGEVLDNRHCRRAGEGRGGSGSDTSASF